MSKSTKDEIEKLVDLVSDIAATCGYEGDIMSKGQRVRFTQALTDLIDKKVREAREQVLTEVIDIAYNNYDFEYTDKEPTDLHDWAVDRLKELKGESDGTA